MRVATRSALAFLVLSRGVQSWSSIALAVGKHTSRRSTNTSTASLHQNLVDKREGRNIGGLRDRGRDWIGYIGGDRTVATAKGRNNKDDEKDTDEDADTEKAYEAEYGVSYIGGDPCGSKYNDDPFDVKVTKPGMPDEMKARIQALAEKKKKENKEK